MYSASSVANAFLRLAEKESKPLTNMQVQKLVFFAHGVYLGAFDQPLVTEEVKAWQFGPVIPPLYNKLKRFGNGRVTEPLASPEGEVEKLGEDKKALAAISAVWNAYKNMNGSQLSKVSHLRDTPWDIVWNQQDRRFGPISNDLIKDYYRSRVRKKETQPA